MFKEIAESWLKAGLQSILTVPGLVKSVDWTGFCELLNSLSQIDRKYSGVTCNKEI